MRVRLGGQGGCPSQSPQNDSLHGRIPQAYLTYTSF